MGRNCYSLGCIFPAAAHAATKTVAPAQTGAILRDLNGGQAVSMQIVGSELARDSEGKIARERASYTAHLMESFPRVNTAILA